MKLKNILITVNDMETSIAFYKELFGLDVILYQEGNVILTEGLVLQDRNVWNNFLGKDIIPENNASALYFEETDMQAFVKKLEHYNRKIQYVNPCMAHDWGRCAIRFYDPDGNLIEVGAPKQD